MLRIDIWPEARAFLETLAAKHKRQVSAKIFALAENPMPPRSKLLEGFPFRRFPSGEYRIVYFVDDTTLKVVLVDRRNDDRIYRRLKQMFR